MSSEKRLSGVGATPRTGVGTAVWYRPEAQLTLSDPPPPENVSPETEHDRFVAARESAREELERERERTETRIGESEAQVLDAHVQFLTDPEIESRVRDAIDEELPAAHAVQRAFEGPIEQFETMEGRMAERADDLRDVRDRLLRILLSRERADLASLPPGSVVLAERLTPTDTARLDPECVAGIVTAEGGRTSHAAIIAGALAIPVVVGVGDALTDVEENETVVVDGDDGVVVRNPSDETYQNAIEDEEVPIRSGRVTTLDGRAIEVAANVGTSAEVDAAVQQGADGVGLFRTEFLFLDRESPPDEDEQFEAYVAALEAFGDRNGDSEGSRIVVRTLDIGGDKSVPYLDLDPIANGFLGARGSRLSLDEHADLFETQLRALLRAAAVGAGRLSVMFPFVATVSEVDALLGRVEEVSDELEDEGVAHAIPELGVMVETPAAAFVAREVAERVDFVSIGTNDLTQYVMAAARDEECVADLHDPLHPAVLRAIYRTVQAAHEAGAWVGVCGEMAGDPELTPLLVGLDVDELSMSAVAVPAVKARVANVDVADARNLATRALDAETRTDVMAVLERSDVVSLANESDNE